MGLSTEGRYRNEGLEPYKNPQGCSASGIRDKLSWQPRCCLLLAPLINGTKCHLKEWGFYALTGFMFLGLCDTDLVSEYMFILISLKAFNPFNSGISQEGFK